MGKLTKYVIASLMSLSFTEELQAQHWQYDPYSWEYDMTAYFALNLNNQAVSNLTEYEIAAFCETECRGVATIQTTEKDGQTITYGYLRIRSNHHSGENITFKVYDSVSEKEYDVEDYTLTFQPQEVVGLPSTPIQFSILDDCNISVASSDTSKGTVEGTTTVKYGIGTTVVAIANEGYHFVNWTIDGNVVSEETPYTFTANGDISLTANFAPNQYSMTFVLDNGDENVVKTQDYASDLSAPTEPTKTGFTFKGWSPEVPATVPASDQTFIAQWERNSYKLTWDVDGVKSESQVLYEASITKPTDPEKEGYTFAGWTPDVAETMPAEDVTYTANWTVNQYSMTFVLDNGDENVVKTQDYASDLSAPTEPTKTGFTFKGWSPEVPATVPASDQTFIAQWERNSYKLTWDVDGVKSESQVLYEASITKPADPSKEGYTFADWTPDVAETMPAEDVTYTANWTVNQYSMTFVLDNGDENVVKTQDYASDLSAPTEPTKTGFTFKGWSPEVPATVPASDQTFIAQWERNSYKLTWDVDGVKSESQVLYEASITKPTDPEKEGYTFTGWTPDVAETMPAEDVTYTANWTVNQYSMTFVLDNGDENVVKTQDYASDLSAPAEPTKTGFTFKGWSPVVPETVPASDQTFTAQWERNSYKLTWDVDGEKTESMVLYEAAITKPTDPEKEGYTFTGWLPDVPRTMPAEDVTFMAQFEANVYTIIYVVNGEEWQRETVVYGEPIVLREYPTESDVDFSGWTSDADYKTMPAHDVTYSASATTGIASLKEGSQLIDVYDLRGRMVLSRVPVSRISKELPNGIYIINGKKVKIAK